MNDLMKKLGLEDLNPGTWTSDGGWLTDTEATRIESINPATGETIASVVATTESQYERVIQSARRDAQAWRDVPAPKRGEAVRLMAEELRRYKSELGSLSPWRWARSRPRATARFRR